MNQSPGTQIGFYFDQSRCLGCYTCVIACRQWHSSDHEVMAWRWVETLESGNFPDLQVSFLSLSCLHCQSPPCEAVCPESAISKRRGDGLVLVDQSLCLGEMACGLCRDVCPYEAPRFNPGREFKMEKCDLCSDRLAQGQEPICVAACPTHALKIGPLSEDERPEGFELEAVGFTYSPQARPAVALKPRRRLRPGG